MKSWWSTKAWPWLKTNWWVVLLAPVLVIPWVIYVIWKAFAGPKVVVLDPLKKADERAAEERETREDLTDAAEVERACIEAELERKVAERTGALEARQEAETPALREDLDEVARRLRR